MKRYLVIAVLAFAPPAFAADAVTTTGFLTSMNNQLQQRVDQFQAGSPSIPANITSMINATQVTIGADITTIKGINPLPNAVSPIQPFTIPAFTPVH